MISEFEKAWVIHKISSGDTSAYIILFTREYGLIKCLYKGGRLPKNQSLTQSFQELWVTISQKRDFNYINKLELMGLPLLLTGDNLFAALYVNELIFNLLKLNDAHPGLYQSYIDTLHLLTRADTRTDIAKILRTFESALLRECGYQISFNYESGTKIKIVPDKFYKFIPGEGFISSENGIQGTYLIDLASNNYENKKVLVVAKKIMQQAINNILDGKEIKTRRLYKVK